MTSKKHNVRSIRVGYVPLSDSAPLIIAKEKKLFEKHGITVELSPEPGWASIRDKIAYGELDAAESIMGLVFALKIGLGCRPQNISVPMIISTNGNAITLANDIPPSEIEDSQRLAHFLRNRNQQGRPFTLAAVHPFSNHHFLLHTWLRQHGLTPGEDASIIFLPPPVMARNLSVHTIDGFCVGEPWNSVAIQAGNGWCASTSRDLVTEHPEKVLLASEIMTSSRREELVTLTKVIYEACEFCQNPSNNEEVIDILSKDPFLDTPKEAIANLFRHKFDSGNGTISTENLISFYGGDINKPTIDKANWVLAGMRQAKIIKTSQQILNISDIFDLDIFNEAIEGYKNTSA